MKKQKALVVGSLTIDVISVIADKDIELVSMSNATTSYLMLQQGRKMDAESISSHIGGGAANVGVSLARQGLMVDMLSARAEDLNGQKIETVLRAEGINLEHVARIEGAHTGTSILVSSHDQNAAIFTERGANSCLKNAHFKDINFANYDLLYIAPLSNDSADIYGELIKKASAANCFIATNPGLRQLTTRANEFLRAAKNIDLLALNVEEAKTILPCLSFAKLGKSKLLGDDEYTKRMIEPLQFGGMNLPFIDALNALFEMGPKNLVVTDGKDGAYLFDNETLVYCPVFDVVPKGTAGAGDAFNSTVAASLVAGKNTSIALTQGAANSASVVSFVDTQTGLLISNKLDDYKDLSRCRSWRLS